MNINLRRRALVFVSSALILAIGASYRLGAQTPAKKPVGYDVMDYWKSIGGTRLSRDGQWLSYAITSQAEDGVLIVRNLKSGAEFKAPRGSAPQFTNDNKFVVFTIAPPKTDGAADPAEAGGEGAAAAGGRGAGRGGAAGGGSARNSLGLMTLADGQVTTIERVSNFRLPEESSQWLAYHRGNAAGANGRGGAGRGAGAGRGGGRQGGGTAAGQTPPATPPAATEPGAPAAAGQATPPATPEKTKTNGSDLIVRNLATGQEVTIPEVTEYAWNKDASWLAYTVSSSDAAKDGAFARRTSDAAVTTLQKGKGNYKSIAFDDAGRQIAFLSDQAEYDKKVSPYRLYYWKAGDAAAAELVSAATKGIAPGMVVSDDFAPRFSEDGARLFLGTAPPPPAPPEPNAKAPIRVDLWNYKDLQLQPMQQVRATQERNRNYRAVVHLSNRTLVQLATKDLPNVNPGEDAARAVGTNDVPYQKEISWDQSYNDVFLVDIKTGSRKKVLEHWGAAATLSPGGQYLMYFDEETGDWMSYRASDGARTNITERIPNVSFQQESHDTPDAAGAYGIAGWTDGDKAVLLYDRFDIWEVKPDGSGARNLTNGEGRKQNIVFRYRSLDPTQRTVPTTGTWMLSATNDWTKASGYYRMPATGGVAPEKLIMLDKAVGAPTKARDADVIVFTESRFEEFPDLWVSNTSFANPQKVSNANPQQSDYVWGKAELVEYINADGKRLRAMLIKPDNFDPSKKYPLMVYIYEELTAGLHSYRAPNVGTSINITRYVSNGYVVLQPDIVYDTGFPGESAEKCVIPAVNTIVAQGYIDPKRIGIQGHSWGGYQITHLITRTDLFAAVEAGASVSNMISAYGGIRWGTGMSRAFQYEKTQSRIGLPPWDAPLKYIENSPIFWVQKIHTPYLTIHNDADDAVPWYQGIEFFTAMRRLNKEAYFFSYNGEPHGLRNRDNMKHWTVHMDEFFDHFLLGKPKPEWMDKGVPFLEKGTRDVSPMFKKGAVNPPAPAQKKGG
ncbi:MAG TPA: prolyl oligopeptidase family serine peptidase [Vicinamibacterales bacterium]|nr:prolyl oligopeptidase family serine peptidase [Vicinamibacterales bacterium]